MPKPQAIFFDVGQTLVEFSKPLTETYRQSALALGGGKISDEDLWSHMEPLFKQSLEWKEPDFRCSDDVLKKFWMRFISQLVEAVPVFKNLNPQQLLNEIWNRYNDSSMLKLFEEVEETLEILHQHHIRLAVVSNWDTRLKRHLDYHGIGNHFEVIAASASVGWSKPSQKIFNHALDSMKISPESCWHVGDNLIEDVNGAQEMGIRPIWVNRYSVSSKFDGIEIDSLKSLLQLLDD